MNSDFKDLLRALNAHGVEYLIVGGYAVIHYTEPRFTKDLDIWIRPSEENAARLMTAFRAFGMPLIDIDESDFAVEGTQYVMGVAPVMLDFLTTIQPLTFAKCWEARTKDEVDGVPVTYLGKEDLILAKRFANRDQDRTDLSKLDLNEES